MSPQHAFRWLLIGATALLVAWVGVGLLAAIRPAEDPCGSFCTSVIRAHTHARLAAEATRDSLRQEAQTAKVVYVVTHDAALAAVRALPPATIVGDSITLPAGTFVVAHPVAVYIADLRDAVTKQSAALVAGDTLVSKTEQVAAASDSVTVKSQQETADQIALRAAGRPGFFARAWNAVKVPVTFVGGVAVGAGAVLLVGRVTR